MDNKLDFEEINDDFEKKNDLKYDLINYGVDYSLEELIRRIKENEIIIPKFQRKYVWKKEDASRLIESFLLNLPVPQIFLFRKKDQTNLVVDGQQRLWTIKFFFEGKFKDGTEFKLTKVRDEWNNKTFEELNEKDKRTLRNSLLRANHFENRDKEKINDVMNEVFDRLNTGGTLLSEQEIRNCIYEGKIIEYLNNLNENKIWRSILNKENEDERLRDILIILRGLALYENWKNYSKPMRGFLDKFMAKYQNSNEKEFEPLKNTFESTIKFVYENLEKKSFKSNKMRGFSVTVFDSVFIAINEIGINNINNFNEKYYNLINNEEFITYSTKATTNEQVLEKRIKLAIKMLKDDL